MEIENLNLKSTLIAKQCLVNILEESITIGMDNWPIRFALQTKAEFISLPSLSICTQSSIKCQTARARHGKPPRECHIVFNQVHL